MFVDEDWRPEGEPHEPPPIREFNLVPLLTLALPLSFSCWFTAVGWFLASRESLIFYGVAKLLFALSLLALWFYSTEDETS